MISTRTSAILDESVIQALPQVAQVNPVASVAGCDVCAHPLDGHDQIARRYCSATFVNVITRGCICG